MSTQTDMKKYWEKTKQIAQNKKVQNILVITLFLITLFIGINIRTEPIKQGNLIDQTTGDYTPLALDPYYFLRIAETMVQYNGDLPEFDEMRSPHLDVEWHKEILPDSTVALWDVVKMVDSDATLSFAHVLNPVVFFALGLILFFVLIWVITKNKWIAVISSFILTIIPPYLYRTLAGFSDHESIGMFGFFLALIAFYSGINYLHKKQITTTKTVLWGLFAGFSTMLSIATWGGIGKFLFMIFPLAFLIMWFTKEYKPMWKYISFYSSWILGIIIGAFIFGYSVYGVIKTNMLTVSGLLTFIVLGYILIETILARFKILNSKLSQYRKIISFISVIVLGSLLYHVFVGNVFNLMSQLIVKILDPFSGGRLAVTVAEQKAPFLTDLISQIGPAIFYSFLAGCFIVGAKIAKGIRNKKFRPLFIGSFAFFIIGILFSKYSQSSILVGNNFISKALFFVSFLVIFGVSVYIYNKSDWSIKTKWIFVVAWMIPMLLAVRSAIRVFFAIVPFISFMVPFALFEVFKWGRKSKEDVARMLSYVAVLAVAIMLIFTSIGFYNSVTQQAKAQTPSYDASWQNAMQFVRENTTEDAMFVHWWDYGYWVQTGGDRATFSDGGHSQGEYGNHFFGRYVLTTPNPATAKSFMKTHNSTHLLIDPTDIGKYSAYSSIGTSKEGDDRTSWIVTLTSDPAETQETRNGTIRIYRGGTVLDDDLVYEKDGEKIFLPKGKAGIGALTIEKINGEYVQPMGIYIYNNEQHNLPIRYLYANGELIDFGEGVNSTIYLYANIYNSQRGQQFDMDGAAMYLSERVKDSLVAKLYLMDDPEDEYEELELVYSEFDYPVPFYYGGYRGPIKIWETHTEEMDDIITHEEFKLHAADYGMLDDFEFVRN